MRPREATPDRAIEASLSLDDLCVIHRCSRRTIEREKSAGRLPMPDDDVGKMPRWRPETIRRSIAEGGRS